MTGMQVFGMLMLPVVWALVAFANERHRDEHGVNAPTRRAMSRIRRNGRRKGIGTGQAYDEWLAIKQAREGIATTREAAPSPVPSATAYGSVPRSSPVPAALAPPAREPATLREWRRSSGMTMREIAQTAGLSEHVVAQIENGTRTADPDTIARLTAVMRGARETLPAALPFEDVVPPPATVAYQQAGPIPSGGYVKGHFRKDGSWVNPHHRKLKGYR